MDPKELADAADIDIRQIASSRLLDTIKQGTFVLFFGSTTCPFTQAFTPKWLAFQKVFDSRGFHSIPSFSIAKVQCGGDGEELCKKMHANGYPTIGIFIDGEWRGELPSGAFEDGITAMAEARFEKWKGIPAPTPFVIEVRPQNHHHEVEEWDPSIHHGMTRTEFRAYSDTLDKSIRQLPVDTLFETIQNGTHIFFFGAVYCPYTQAYNEHWLAMQQQYDLDPVVWNQVQIAKIQCATNQPLCFRWMNGEEGFPTIVLYHEGSFVEELNDRDHVWEFIQDRAKELRERGRLLLPGEHSKELLTHAEDGGTGGMTPTVVALEFLLCTVIVVLFVMRRKGFQKSYKPIK
ncbi:hypothetical protein HDU98_002106 [Podochytrium sp. JEL0797]|nr:hypothetical protein HDU98_002106 [Podochytrium sp. JEL0797]